MKKFILGIVWQVMGFLGAMLLVCTAALEGPWDYNGITGLAGALLGTDLLLPLLVCGALFLLGCGLCYQAFRMEERQSEH